MIDQSPAISGGISTYSFIFSTVVPLNDGDIVQFEFPPQILLPSQADLIIVPVPRDDGNGNQVTDNLIIEKVGTHRVNIIFVNVAPTVISYAWKIENIKNPTSLQPTGPFINFTVLTYDGYIIQVFPGTGPTV